MKESLVAAQPESKDLFSAGNLRKQLRLARAWRKGGKPALRAELAKMYPEKAAAASADPSAANPPGPPSK
jgi:hypothetical protein